MCPPSMYQDMEEFINCPGKYKTIYGTLDKKSNPNSCTSKCWNVRAGVLEYTGENNCGPYVSNSVAFCHSGYTTSYDGGLVCADSNENFYYNICNSQGMTSEDAAIIAEAQGVTSDKRYSFGFSATSFFIACHLHYEDELTSHQKAEIQIQLTRAAAKMVEVTLILIIPAVEAVADQILTARSIVLNLLRL